MYEKKSSTLLRGCTQLANWHSHYKGCQCHQNKNQPVDLHSTESTGDPCSLISILNVTRYATQMNKQHINILMDTTEKTQQDITTLYNTMHSLYSSISYHQIILHIRSILANLQDSLHYVREITFHTIAYINAATTGILSPHILPVQDLRKMLKYIEETLPSMMHLPISSEDTLHFYRYLLTHILITDEQFLLLIDVSIQDHAQQVEVYEVFNLDIPHGNYSLCYYIDNKYLGITLDETSTIEILEDQFQTCKRANGQFYILNTPLLPLSNPPTCLSSLYTKERNGIQKRCSLQVKKPNSISIPTSITPNVWIITSSPAAAPARITFICPSEAPRTIMPQTPIHILRLKPACCATSQHFHLPPRYESHDVSINISLNTANLNVVNISAPEF